MSDTSYRAGRWIAAAIAMAGLALVFYNLVIDNMPKGEARKIDGYLPWSQETLKIVETLPVQDGGRIKPLSTYAGFTMLGMHGARSMEIADAAGETHRIRPTAWLLDVLFRPQFAINSPTFRVDNSAALEAIGVKPRGRRDRYSYADIQPGREKLGELAGSYGSIDSKARDPLQTQIIDLASNLRTYESLLGWFSFARGGIVLRGSGENGAPDKRADVSALMTTAPQIREQIDHAGRGQGAIPPHLQDLMRQVLDAANFSKFGLFILPPADPSEPTWKSAGNAIMDVMGSTSKDPARDIEDIRMLEATARAGAAGEDVFRKQFVQLRDHLAARAAARGEGQRVALEASYYQKNWFLYALVFFLIGTLAAMGMWTLGGNKTGRGFSWLTLAASLAGLTCCVIAITKRCIIMQRPPVGNLYDTIIFISAAVVLLALIVEWLTRRRFALGVAPILGTALIVLARRYELGDANDHMDPLVAVLDSNFWLTTHVITITLGYSAGLLSAFLSTGFVLLCGLRLDRGDISLRRSLTRAAYGMLCLTLFLSLVGTVLGGIWANYSWGRFWGWDPKENGALLIVIWTLAVLHARLGGYLREWGLHLASIFTAIVVTFSWWHVNFLGVGLHNYGFTAGKNTIWAFYACMGAVLLSGSIAMVTEKERLSKNG
ncbi:MAG: cytochrome c biogenesis protein CcsA [Luteolibacter sp.]|jgi:ABC-type transport system involved in cytochrome c biogenesis permease subunit|nr:cytochrome c biogenesis protein CcsA [Luteolibacter sp.]